MTELLSVAEAVRRIGVSLDEAYQLVIAGQLSSVEGPTGRRLVPAGAVDRWRSVHAGTTQPVES